MKRSMVKEYDHILDLTEEDAAKSLAKNGIKLRITRVDGNPSIVTQDYRLDRLNVWTENGKIVYIAGLG